MAYTNKDLFNKMGEVAADQTLIKSSVTNLETNFKEHVQNFKQHEVDSKKVIEDFRGIVFGEGGLKTKINDIKWILIILGSAVAGIAGIKSGLLGKIMGVLL